MRNLGPVHEHDIHADGYDVSKTNPLDLWKVQLHWNNATSPSAAGQDGKFGDEDLSGVFNASDPSWDGHCWIVVGDRIADVSICRTAKSGKAPPALASHMRQTFESKTGLLIQSARAAAEAGLFYRPRYMLTQNQVDTLARGVSTMISPPSPHAD